MLTIKQYEFGGPEVLRTEQVPDLAPGAGQVRIAVEAAGVHLIHTRIRAGTFFGSGRRPRLPTVPGSEVAGAVDAVGEDVDPSWLGARVVAHLGTAGGGYAEQAVVDVAALHGVPDPLDAVTAVAAVGTGRTAAGIVRLAPVGRDDVALVTSAAGGLGVLLLQAARAAGARTVGVASGVKLEIARRYGAEIALDRGDPDWPTRVPERPTVVFDGVGGEVGRRAYDLLVDGGRLVRFGWSSGVSNDYDDPRRPVVDVLGPRMSGLPGGLAALEQEALARAADGSMVPYVGSTFPLADAAQAHRALEAGETTGKVVLLAGTMGR